MVKKHINHLKQYIHHQRRRNGRNGHFGQNNKHFGQHRNLSSVLERFLQKKLKNEEETRQLFVDASRETYFDGNVGENVGRGDP